jgi:hypothetical protein
MDAESTAVGSIFEQKTMEALFHCLAADVQQLASYSGSRRILNPLSAPYILAGEILA